jgi:hypothetical protein
MASESKSNLVVEIIDDLKILNPKLSKEQIYVLFETLTTEYYIKYLQSEDLPTFISKKELLRMKLKQKRMPKLQKDSIDEKIKKNNIIIQYQQLKNNLVLDKISKYDGTSDSYLDFTTSGDYSSIDYFKYVIKDYNGSSDPEIEKEENHKSNNFNQTLTEEKDNFYLEFLRGNLNNNSSIKTEILKKKPKLILNKEEYERPVSIMKFCKEIPKMKKKITKIQPINPSTLEDYYKIIEE